VKEVRIRGRPQNPDCSIPRFSGKYSEISVEQGYEAAKLPGLSILGTLHGNLGHDLTAWLHVGGMISSVLAFTQTTTVINGFSDLIFRLYRPKIGAHACSAIGVQSLP
jgi:hypothetical protein